MRLRKKKNTPRRLEEYKNFFVSFSEEETVSFSDIFGNHNPVHMEIGAGKGDFITTLARQNPDINYLAFEKVADVIAIAATKAEGIQNLRFANVDAEIIDRIFPKNSISRIYLNFSDPWPKERHRKKRLTHQIFLEKYKKLLTDAGEIHFKTDNQKLFRFTLLETKEFGMKWELVSFDLHHEHPENNIMTEYERRFSEQGYPIQKLIARF